MEGPLLEMDSVQKYSMQSLFVESKSFWKFRKRSNYHKDCDTNAQSLTGYLSPSNLQCRYDERKRDSRN